MYIPADALKSYLNMHAVFTVRKHIYHLLASVYIHHSTYGYHGCLAKCATLDAIWFADLFRNTALSSILIVQNELQE